MNKPIIDIDFNNTDFAVIGLGQTGCSIVNYLRYKGNKSITLFDTRVEIKIPQWANNYPIHLGDLTVEKLTNFSIILLSPGVSIYDPCLSVLNNNKTIIGDMQLFALEINQWLDTKVIAITGTNGKTTVSNLAYHVAINLGIKAWLGGNIGICVLDLLIQLKDDNTKPELIILEISSFQLETIQQFQFAAAVVLNVSEDHLDRYTSLLQYASIKAKIFAHSAVMILNNNDPLVSAMKNSNFAPNKADILYFGLEVGDYYLINNGTKTYLFGDNFKLDSAQLILNGTHNYLNSLAVGLLFKVLGYQFKKIASGLTTFKSIEHRMEQIKIHRGVIFIEDSKATNVGATIAGLTGINGGIHLILGGEAKGQDFNPLRNLVKQKCVSLCLIGRDRNLIKNYLNDLAISIIDCTSLAMAVKYCYTTAKAGEYVILSPACASLDMFDNYKHRALIFAQAVQYNIDQDS